MNEIQSKIKREIEKLWPQAQKTLGQLNKDASKLIKKTEKNLVAAYTKTRKATETLLLQAQREKLIYELGKAVAPLLTSDQLKNKKILAISSEIRQVTRKLHSKR